MREVRDLKMEGDDSQQVNKIKTFIYGLLEPSEPVDTRERRRKIVFQLKILYSVIFIIPLFIIWELFFTSPSQLSTDPNFLLAVFVLVSFCVGVHLSRKDKLELSSLLIILSTTSAIFIMSFYNFAGLSENYPKDDVNVLLFLILPILLTVTLLDMKKSFAIIVSDLGLMLIIPIIFPHITLNDIIMGPFVFIGMVSIFLMVFSHHQNKLEQDRRSDLKDREEKLRSMLTSSPDGIILTELDTSIINCNRAVLDMLGYDTKREIRGKDIFKFISPDDMSKASANYKKTLSYGRTRNIEYQLMKKDDSTFPSVISSSVISDEEGEAKALIFTIKDITEQKETQRWESLLDSIIRTDIKRGNQLINGYLELLKESDLDDDQEEIVDRTLSSSKDQNELIRKVDILRNLGKEYSRGKVNPYFLLEGSIDRYRPKLEDQGIDISFDVEKTRTKVVSEGRGGVLIESVFNNLLDSALKYSNAEQLEVEASESDDHVKISFIDDGDMEEREGIFDIVHGYVSRGKMSEAEFSLFLVKNIVETFDGRIEINRSSIGRIRFDVYLKRC